MTASVVTEQSTQNRLRVAAVRKQAQILLDSGAAGVEVATTISEGMDRFVIQLFLDAIGHLGSCNWRKIERNAAVVAVGGSGRGAMAPYSDIDLLFLYRGVVQDDFMVCVAQFVRDCWDAGLTLGHSVRTVNESITIALNDSQVATSLIEVRRLWGSDVLVRELKGKFCRRVIRRRLPKFIEDCLTARDHERWQHGAVVQQLEPDVKRALGGLRDLHMIRWMGFANFGTSDIDALCLRRVLGSKDSKNLRDANEFLTRIRIELHFAAGKAQDVLGRDDQLRIAKQRAIESMPGQSSVEVFMQEYFRHSMAVADLAKRFTSLNRPKSLRSRLITFAGTHRINKIFKVGPAHIDVVGKYRESLCSNLQDILKIYQLAASYRVDVAPLLAEQIKESAFTLSTTVSPEEAKLFLSVLGTTGNLGLLVRSMHDTGVLEILIPEFKHAHCLLQFNLYHKFTVDEHILQAVESVELFEQNQGPVGTAYRKINNRQILHLALMLHDLGKGFPGDHSQVGRRIAERTARRFHLSADQREVLIFLVYKHLMMSHLALRRDITDPKLLLRFSHEVGSPETLRMLYVLTAADLMAVGPGVWTNWKADLLTDLYNRAMHILSGKPHQFNADEHLKKVRGQVLESMTHDLGDANQGRLDDWYDEQFNVLPLYYLSSTVSEQIAADLHVIRTLQSDEIVLEGQFDSATGTVDYRVITNKRFSAGCFHRIVGVLTANRLKILSAQISTTQNGVVIDGFRVVDRDYAGDVPQSRIDLVTSAIRNVLIGRTTVEELFRRYKRFDAEHHAGSVSDLPMRVVIDNSSSERCTVIDVFAYDRTGLLYTIARTVFELNFSVELAKIATHFDQVVDVLYVTDISGRKINDQSRLRAIQDGLESKIAEFQCAGYLRFV